MAPTPSAVMFVARLLFLFGYALLFAAVEIEIEGPDGWAARLPTWYRITPGYARLYGLFMRGKPLTGYHAVMFVLPLWSFHLGFVAGVGWSGAAELATLAAYLAWIVAWDFLWFILNPPFGWNRFRKGEVWWHGGRWIGRFPIDYYGAVVTSLLLAASATLMRRDFAVLFRQVGLIAGLALLVRLVAAFAPVYMRWHTHMRRPGSDERQLCLPESMSGASGDGGHQPR